MNFFFLSLSHFLYTNLSLAKVSIVAAVLALLSAGTVRAGDLEDAEFAKFAKTAKPAKVKSLARSMTHCGVVGFISNKAVQASGDQNLMDISSQMKTHNFSAVKIMIGEKALEQYIADATKNNQKELKALDSQGQEQWLTDNYSKCLNFMKNFDLNNYR